MGSAFSSPSPNARPVSGLIALLLAVFPANIYAAMHGMNVGSWTVPAWALWVRLPLQAVLIWWTWRVRSGCGV